MKNRKTFLLYLLVFFFSFMFFFASNGKQLDLFFEVALSCIFCCSILFFVVYVFILKNTVEIFKLFPIWAFMFGVVFFFVIPTYMTPDEPVHLCNAYYISNSILGVDNEPSIKMRSDDYYAEMNQIISTNHPAFSKAEIRRHFNVYYKEISNVFVDDANLIDSGKHPIDYDYYMYFLPAVGITIGRLLGLGTVPTYMLGTLFNLLLYIVLATLAIYFIPAGKEVLFTLGLMPIVLQEVVSFSADSFIISFSFIVIALSFLIIKKLKLSENGVGRFLLFWGAAMALLVPAKKAVCSPLFLFSIVFFMQTRDARIRKQIVFVSVAVFIYVCVYMLVRFFDVDFIGGPVDRGWKLSCVLMNPKKVVRMCFNTIRLCGDYYARSFLGNHMGWLNFGAPEFVTLGYVFCLLIAHGKKERMCEKGGRCLCYVMVLLMVASVFAALLLAWTPRESFTILGIQGRYFFTSILLLLLTIDSKYVFFKESVTCQLTNIVPALNIVFVAFLYASIGQQF